METFWSVRANKVMEIVPMEATEKGVERGREREGEPKTDSHNVVCQPACLLKIVFASLGAIHIRQRGRRKAQGLGKVGDAAEEGGGRSIGIGLAVGGYLSLFAEGERFTSELPYWIRQ